MGNQIPLWLASPDLALAPSNAFGRPFPHLLRQSWINCSVLTRPLGHHPAGVCCALWVWLVYGGAVLMCLRLTWTSQQICFLKQMAVCFSALSRTHLATFDKFKAASQTELMNRINWSFLSYPSLYSGFKMIIQFHLSMTTCPGRCLLFLTIELILYVRIKGVPRC